MLAHPVHENLARGWNTWNTRSVLSHVLLPQGLAINLGIKSHQTGKVIRESLIGRFGEEEEKIHPGPKSYDGSYSELVWNLHDLKIKVESAVVDGEQCLYLTPQSKVKKSPTVLVEIAMLWNRAGTLSRDGDTLQACIGDETISVRSDQETCEERNAGSLTPYLALPLSRPIAIWTGPKPKQPMPTIMATARTRLLERKDRYGNCGQLYDALHTSLAWDTIYEPEKRQVCSPVSRLWNLNWGGYVLFCWDTYFAAMMALSENPDLAMANALSITREKTENGFVPNFGAANDFKSRDRSQPPVGALAVREIYRKTRDKAFVETLFDDLLTWNRWWTTHRMTEDHTLCWGSDPYEPRSGAHWEENDVGNLAGAALESGLDNSPMYDDLPFDEATHTMALADVGLTGLYILDCLCLSDLAKAIGRPEVQELLERAEAVEVGLETLWDEKDGLYQNRRTDTGKWHPRFSPTHFYALFSRKVSPERARRMIDEHFYNEQEFWGAYMLPSIARNDPAYPDQDYWRGRIWAPMNYLAYLAMRRHEGIADACRDLAEKSSRLFLQEWHAHGHVHENYDGESGWGCNVRNSDKFYHWGALLCQIALTEDGIVPGPEKPL